MEIIGAALTAACIAVSPSAHAGGRVDLLRACTMLEDAVYEVVLQASAGMPDRAAVVRERPANRLTCHDTARAVSSGFTRAMAERNVYLRWQYPGEVSGDLCLSADLSQCYPGRNPFVPFAKGDAAFVADSWHGVLQAVGALMPRVQPGDVTRFGRSELSSLLDGEIRRGQHGRTQQAYYLH